MYPGFRAQVRREMVETEFVRVPDGTFPGNVGGRCAVTSHASRTEGFREARFRAYIMIEDCFMRRWKDDPKVQIIVLHEMAHAHMNPHLSRAVMRSHFLSEAGATVWGYVRFGHLAPKVRRRDVIRYFLKGWGYYTRDVGLNFGVVLALWYANLDGRILGFFIVERRRDFWDYLILAAAFAVISLVIIVEACRADARAKRRGLKSFRLNGIW